MSEKLWEKQHEIVLKNWAEISSCYSWMHDRAYRDFKIKNMHYAIPVIILSTLTGTANFAQQNIPEKYREMSIMIIGSLNLISGLITTLAQFFKVNELQEAHRSSCLMFSKFSRNISVELNLPVNDRIADGATFLENSRQEYNRMLEQSPPIPTKILISFNKTHKNNLISKPAITHLHEISVYRDYEYENKRDTKIQNENNIKIEKQKLLEHQKTMKNLHNLKKQMSFSLPTFLTPEKLDESSDSSETKSENEYSVCLEMPNCDVSNNYDISNNVDL
jgi:hypothetical protein